MKILGFPTIAGQDVPKANMSISSIVGIPSQHTSIISSWFVLVFSLPCDLTIIRIEFDILGILLDVIFLIIMVTTCK